MKICFICSEYPPGPHGGIGTMTQVIGRGLAKLGHQVRVIGVYPENHSAPEFEVDHGVEVFRIRGSRRRLRWIAARQLLYRQVAKWVNAGDVDIIEVPDFEGWAAGWPSLSVPVIARLHGSVSYFNSELGVPVRKAGYWFEARSLRRADFLCSTCHYTADQTHRLFRLKSEPATVIYNPVECSHEPRTPPIRPNDVVFSGTLTAKKGVIPLINAWPAVKAALPDAVLHLYGKDGRHGKNGSMREHLISLLPSELTESVKFHGHVSRDRLFAAYRSAGVAVFPSYVEAFAMAPLEAMGCGCPTIYSVCGSGREVLEHGREGLLVNPDKPSEIASAILGIMSDRALAEEMGEAGRKRVENSFSIQLLLKRNVDFYENCIERFKGTRTHSSEREFLSYSSGPSAF